MSLRSVEEEVSMEPSDILGYLCHGTNTIKRMTRNNIMSTFKTNGVMFELLIPESTVFLGETLRGEVKLIASTIIKDFSVYLRLSCMVCKEQFKKEEEEKMQRSPNHQRGQESYGRAGTSLALRNQRSANNIRPPNHNHTAFNIQNGLDRINERSSSGSDKFNVSLREKLATENVDVHIHFKKSQKLFTCDRDFKLFTLCTLPFIIEIPKSCTPSATINFSQQENITYKDSATGSIRNLEKLEIVYKLNAFIEDNTSHKVISSSEMINIYICTPPQMTKKPKVMKTFQLDSKDFSPSLFQKFFCSCGEIGMLRIEVAISREEINLVFSGPSFKSETIQAFSIMLRNAIDICGNVQETEIWHTVCIPTQGKEFSFTRVIKQDEIQSRPSFDLAEYKSESYFVVSAHYTEEESKITGKCLKEVTRFKCDYNMKNQIRRNPSKSSTFKTHNYTNMSSVGEGIQELPFSRLDYFD